jgi:hypothetical protein
MAIQSLKELLYSKLKWHPARICTFYNLILAVLSGGSVRIKDMAQYIETRASLHAKVVRLERWFLKQKLDYILIGKIIVGLMVCSIRKVTIAIDRTNWQYGKKDLNFLVASIICGNISIPVVWLLLDKKGSSSAFERIGLIDKLVAVISVSRIENILADREFACKEFIKYLCKYKLPFTFRVKKNEQLRHENGGKMKLGRYFKDMVSEERNQRRCRFYGEVLNITCLQLEREQLFIVSNVKIGKAALLAYKQRWSIERTFKALKQSGFWMEITHMTDLEKLGKLMAILSIALAVAVLGGKIKNSIIPIKIKKHGRPQWSIFTYGLDWLISAFIHNNNAFLRRLFRLLDIAIADANI